MSRIANKPIEIPKSIELKLTGQKLMAKGPKGQLEYDIHDKIAVEIKDNLLTVSIKDGGQAPRSTEKKFIESLLGTTCSNISNIVVGVNIGYEKKLLLVGVGYRAQLQGKNLNLSLGYSFPVTFPIPENITIESPSPTEIIVKGADKQLVGQVAANIRAVRSVEPYKGKGVRYSDERVSLKETKKK